MSFIYFSSRLGCPLWFENFHQTRQWEGFLVFGNVLYWLPSLDGSPSLALLSLFLSFIFCPTSFWRQWAAFLGVWCPLLAIRSCFVEPAQRSNDLSMNLWGRKWSPRPSPPQSWLLPPDNCLLTHKVFSFSESPVYLFCLLFPVPLVPYHWNRCQVQYHEDFYLYFLPRILRFASEWVKSLSRVRLFATPCAVAYQAPLSMGFSRHRTGVGCHLALIFNLIHLELIFVWCEVKV